MGERMKQHWWDKEDEIYSWLYGKKGYGGGPVDELLKHTYGRMASCIKILDAGCGKCNFACKMHSRGFPGTIYGIDVSKHVIEHAPKECCTVHGSLDNMPFETDFFDGLWCCDVMEHIPPEKVDKVLTELRRVLKSDGKISFSISGLPARWKGPQGEELHLTIKKIDWWVSVLASHGLPIEFQYIIPRRESYIIWG